MARNVEIKARIDGVEALTARVAALADRGPVEIRQDDAFFTCEQGRLKLRALSADEGQLIFYRRPNQRGPKESFFVISPTASPDTLRQALSLAYGRAGRVRKHRTLYLVGRTRVHLDRVEGLGDFLELEVVLAEDEPSASGVEEAGRLMAALDIAPAQLVEAAYVDLLEKQQRKEQGMVEREAAQRRLEQLWAEHLRGEFETKDVEATLATMVEDAYVNHMPVNTGGRGKGALRRFYRDDFIPSWPDDLQTTTVNRVVGEAQLVDELHSTFTHDRPMNWFLPNVPPTHRKIEMDLVVVVQFRGDKIACERIYWDHAKRAAASGPREGGPCVTAGHALVYVGNAESNAIHVLRLDRQSGDLTPVEKVTIPGIAKPGNSTPMALSPDRRFLYVGTRGEPMVAAGYAIDPAAGTLTHVASGPLADSMAYIAVDRTGRFLLGASYPGNKITVNPIGPPGTVRPVQQTLPNHPKAHSILPDASNRHVLVPTLGNDRVNQFTFDATTGMLASNTPPSVQVKDGAGPRHFAFHPNGKLVYVLGELDGSVYVFDYDAAAGQLKEKQAVSALPPDFQGKPSAADLHLTPDGRFLYASVRATSTLAGFKVDPAGGTLTPIGSVPTEKQPRGFTIDPSGRYLLAVGQLSHAMSTYRIDADSGQLTKLKEYPMGQNPNWIEIVELP